ncbi:MAG: Transcriptional activator RfaH [Pedosphaera sp.]|nr:Transcriptional activator RfaH [Pedosphaera sp.]
MWGLPLFSNVLPVEKRMVTEDTEEKGCIPAVVSKQQQAWYCIRSKPKHEHIAAANLSQLAVVEVFNPRLRSRKATRRGPVWMTESLFPNYVFARFAFNMLFDEVKHTRGVSGLVHFGDRYPSIPDDVIEELRRSFAGSQLELSPEVPRAGDLVTITSEAMFGLQGVVLRFLPAKQRVQVLLDILGRNSSVDFSLDSVVVEKQPLPRELLS